MDSDGQIRCEEKMSFLTGALHSIANLSSLIAKPTCCYPWHPMADILTSSVPFKTRFHPAKVKHGDPERLAEEFFGRRWPFQDQGSLINTHIYHLSWLLMMLNGLMLVSDAPWLMAANFE